MLRDNSCITFEFHHLAKIFRHKHNWKNPSTRFHSSQITANQRLKHLASIFITKHRLRRVNHGIYIPDNITMHNNNHQICFNVPVNVLCMHQMPSNGSALINNKTMNKSQNLCIMKAFLKSVQILHFTHTHFFEH